MLLIQQEAQREGDGAAQAAVRNDELVLGGQLDDAELVDKEGQTDNTWGKKEGKEEASSEALQELAGRKMKLASTKKKKKENRYGGIDLRFGVIYNQSTRCKFANPELVTV